MPPIPHTTLIEAVDLQARTMPAQPAIAWEGGECTYGELARLSDRMAAQITAAGIGPRQVIAVELDEGPAAVATLIATVRTGTVAVWVHADTPPERAAVILADCRPAAVVRPDGNLEVLAATSVLDGVPLGTCCLVYTSGSTGTPKAIVQQAANLDQICRWLAAEVGLRPGSRMLQLARMSYDAAYAEVFAALHAGATLVIPPAAVKGGDVAAIARWAEEREVTHLQLVPALCQALLQIGEQTGASPLSKVQVISLFGEQLRAELLTACRRHAPAAEIFNFYGPTECTLATFHRVTHVVAGEAVPIGNPIPGREVLLWDDNGRAVAEGEPGEVVVRSRFLAHGYLNRPEATARVFTPDPRSEPGFRLYHTGDLARRLPNGQLVFVGRRDEQVKIRGARVEPGEIEAVLLRHNDIAEAAVVATTGAGEPARLIAVLKAQPGRSADLLSLHRHLLRSLPPYMIPAQYVEVGELPRTSTGKIDRKALAGLRAGHERDSFTPPATRTERELSRIWQRVLEVERIGRADDFFALGGQSLLAPQVVAAVNTAFGIDLPIEHIFEYPTLDALSARIDEIGGVVAPEPAPVGGTS